MNSIEEILNDFDFSEDFISEVMEYDTPEYFDNHIPVIECEVCDDNSYFSNSAIVGENY